MPVPLLTAFSELALTELRLNSINADIATTNVTRSADCVAATPKKRKKKKGGAKDLEWWSSHFNFLFHASSIFSFIIILHSLRVLKC